MGLIAPRRAAPAAAPRRERGAILVYALIALLLMFLGALFALRQGLTDTSLTDRFSERQKNTQASDLALQWISTQIGTTGLTSPLEVSASSQSWFRAVPAASAAAPSQSYWQTCMSKSTSTDTCAQASMPTGTTQTAWVFVQPTGRTDTSACNTQGLTAVYYDVWIHTLDARGQVGTDTEAVYKLCIR
jgi:Tfp pilus assembly protein PilX